jgi:hypothetical protein
VSGIAILSLATAEDIYHPHRQHPEHTAPEAVVFRLWRHGPGTPAQLQGQMKGPMPVLVEEPELQLASAYVSHGRWAVDCPYEGCFSAQYASKSDHRFFCIECDNGGTGKWVTVVWPSAEDLAAIETTLLVRPGLANRNWLPDEPVANLLEENKAAAQ